MSESLERKMITREKRLSTISHYNGTLESLLEDTEGDQLKQRIRTLTQINQDEVIAAIRVLASISQAVVIVHGVVGCAASGLAFLNEDKHEISLKKKQNGWQKENRIYSTNLCERDTILGGEEKLRQAINRAYEETNPKVIFIVGTPVVAINNDDVNSMLYDFEDIDAKIIPINTDGFKTKTFITGYDLVLHSLLFHVVKGRKEGEAAEEFLNVVSVSENSENRAAIAEILDALEIPYQFVPAGQDIDVIEHAAYAKGTIVLNRDEGGYFAKKLEDIYGVPYIVTKSPIGIRGTRHFIRQIAKFYQKEELAEVYVRNQEEQIGRDYAGNPLQAKKVFVEASPYEIQRFNTFIHELGGELSGLCVPYVDENDREAFKHLEATAKNIPVIVAVGQLFEKANVLSKRPADCYISTFGGTSFVAERGTLPINLKDCAYMGYKGIVRILQSIERGKLQAERYLPENSGIAYKENWLKKSSNWYVKKEVS